MSRKKKIDTKLLVHAVCPINVIPIRTRPSETEVMVSQMLFGEVCTVLEKKNKFWNKIKSQRDEVIGWVQTSQIQYISETDFFKYSESYSIALELCYPIMNEENAKSIVIGSSLPRYDGLSCVFPDGKYIYNGQAADVKGLEYSDELLLKLCKRYLWSPELLGGRSPFGIDSPGFVQNIYNFFGIKIPRFASEQYASGDVIDFIELSQVGDIAFFYDHNGDIHHAGIVIGHKKIIHVYGCVRIDKLDHYGIFNKDQNRYTHKLRIIKRYGLK